MTATSYRPAPSTPGPVWRDANVRSGPSLDSPVVDLLLPDGVTAHTAEGWTLGDEVVEGENPVGEIVSSVWFKFADGRWCSAVNFDPAHLRSVLGDAAPLVRPHSPEALPGHREAV
ncbi:hypothetical protein GCM10010415_37450 [Streptomyces atrovirens]|uniref:Uncharacterized protein n=1 Tax=Streptomyces atrovirens TaxID=285556 RepID=A0ABW0DPJ7_9ACTN